MSAQLIDVAKHVMIVDGGARGHALALVYSESSSVDLVTVTPGNDGIRNDYLNKGMKSGCPIIVYPNSSLKKPESILAAARSLEPDLIDVAQDDALALGSVDLLQKEGFSVFGPNKDAAQIEWDKVWARKFMTRHGIATPQYHVFHRGENPALASDLLQTHEHIFFKASGLYGGKGVIPVYGCAEIPTALEKLSTMGPASERFLVEEGLKGEEFSYYALANGENFVCFASAQDNKRAFNSDKGENTGGMGAHSPAMVTSGLEKRIEKEIIAPALAGLVAEGRPYRGILYIGGMLCEDGSVRVIEFNARWGDPECHVILPGILTGDGDDYFTLVQKALTGKLFEAQLVQSKDIVHISIVGAMHGYPGSYEKNKRLFVDYGALMDTKYLHLLSEGISVQGKMPYTTGGRVFSVVAEGSNVLEARERALQGMACCSIEGNNLHYRTDIAWRDVERYCRAHEGALRST